MNLIEFKCDKDGCLLYVEEFTPPIETVGCYECGRFISMNPTGRTFFAQEIEGD
jgi:hypothetical protein